MAGSRQVRMRSQEEPLGQAEEQRPRVSRNSRPERLLEVYLVGVRQSSMLVQTLGEKQSTLSKSELQEMTWQQGWPSQKLE